MRIIFMAEVNRYITAGPGYPIVREEEKKESVNNAGTVTKVFTKIEKESRLHNTTQTFTATATKEKPIQAVNYKKYFTENFEHIFNRNKRTPQNKERIDFCNAYKKYRESIMAGTDNSNGIDFHSKLSEILEQTKKELSDLKDIFYRACREETRHNYYPICFFFQELTKILDELPSDQILIDECFSLAAVMLANAPLNDRERNSSYLYQGLTALGYEQVKRMTPPSRHFHPGLINFSMFTVLQKMGRKLQSNNYARASFVYGFTCALINREAKKWSIDDSVISKAACANPLFPYFVIYYNFPDQDILLYSACPAATSLTRVIDKYKDSTDITYSYYLGLLERIQKNQELEKF